MITTHVLDTARGGAAVGVAVTLEVQGAGEWQAIGRAITDESGRATLLTGPTGPTEGRAVDPGTYRLTFDIGTYQRQRGIERPFFPRAVVTFDITDGSAHYHVPLLVSPFGYSTYRGA